MLRPGGIVVATGVALASAAASVPAQEALTRVSVDSNGSEANYDCSHHSPPRISDDGRFVVFDSFADNLVANDTNLSGDIFVHDRVSGGTVRVSVSSSGAEADSSSEWPDISADGRLVAFHSFASNLVANDANASADIFVHDRDPDGNGTFDEGNGVTTRLSVDANGAEGDGHSFSPYFSGDGRLVSFHSKAGNLVSGDSNKAFDVFVHDRANGTTTRVSVDSAGGEGDGDSLYSAISADGRVVAFPSLASDLVAGDTNGCSDVFVHDLASGITTRVSVDSAGDEGDAGSFGPPDLTTDGALVAFSSVADDLVAGDANGKGDVFVHDFANGTTERVSVDSAGAEGDGDSYWPSLSADGSLVAFASYAQAFADDDDNWEEDVFLHDRAAGTTAVVSATCAGAAGDMGSHHPSLTPDGLFVLFTSHASNLVDGDTNDYSDVFVRDRTVTEPEASWTNYGAGFAGTNGIPALTASADPEFGATISIDLGNSLGAKTVGLLLLGAARTSIPTSAGGTILVDFDLLLPLVIDAAGLSIQAEIPRDDVLCGIAADLQALELDPGATKGISFTPGLELVIGH